MKIAIDKNSLNAIDNENEYIYVFKDESLKDLIKLNMKCVHIDYIDYVDINLTPYDIECIKKTNINEKDYNVLPKKKDYKFVAVVPNFNNDHGDYNGKTYLQNCIESVLNQKYKNIELVVVDDMSTDTSENTIKNYEKLDSRVHLVKNSRKRYNGGSRNVGIEYALENLDFDYFCFLDSDDWWKDEDVLTEINSRLYNHDMLIFGAEAIKEQGVIYNLIPNFKEYENFFCSDNDNLWCTAWIRVIRKDKIAFFCEDTLMEDRVWSYRQADNVDFKNVVKLKRICYVWNRMNVTNSVSTVRSGFWDASAYCHIGHQLQLIEQLKHKEMIPVLQQRINKCISKVWNGVYQQY